MWDLPGSGLEPVSPALAGGFLTTAPPGKSQYDINNYSPHAVHYIPETYFFITGNFDSLYPFCLPPTPLSAINLFSHVWTWCFDFVFVFKIPHIGTSLAVQWLRLLASNAGGAGSIPGWGTKIPHTTQPKKKIPHISEIIWYFSFSDSFHLA